MRRLFISLGEIHNGLIRITDADDVFYLSTVLRLRRGDGLYVSDGISKAYETRIAEVGRKEISLEVLEEKPIQDSGKVRISLYQGLPKGSKMDEIVRKTTELGVSRIVPVVMLRSVPSHDDGVSSGKLGRWRRIAEEAARQSRLIYVPEVSSVVRFSEAVESLKGEEYDVALVLYELEEGDTLKSVLQAEKGFQLRKEGRPSSVAIFIGPEGGFEREEINALLEAGAKTVTIGETILRTETAGPAAIAMTMYELEL